MSMVSSKFNEGDVVICIHEDTDRRIVMHPGDRLVVSGASSGGAFTAMFRSCSWIGYDSHWELAPAAEAIPPVDKALEYLKVRLTQETAITAVGFIHRMLRDVYGLEASQVTTHEFVPVKA